MFQSSYARAWRGASFIVFFFVATFVHVKLDAILCYQPIHSCNQLYIRVSVEESVSNIRSGPHQKRREDMHIMAVKSGGLTMYIAVVKLKGIVPDSKVHGAHMVPTWVLSAPDWPQVGPINIAIRSGYQMMELTIICSMIHLEPCAFNHHGIFA